MTNCRAGTVERSESFPPNAPTQQIAEREAKLKTWKPTFRYAQPFPPYKLVPTLFKKTEKSMNKNPSCTPPLLIDWKCLKIQRCSLSLRRSFNTTISGRKK